MRVGGRTRPMENGSSQAPDRFDRFGRRSPPWRNRGGRSHRRLSSSPGTTIPMPRRCGPSACSSNSSSPCTTSCRRARTPSGPARGRPAPTRSTGRTSESQLRPAALADNRCKTREMNVTNRCTMGNRTKRRGLVFLRVRVSRERSLRAAVPGHCVVTPRGSDEVVDVEHSGTIRSLPGWCDGC